jgi:hypothetical protein
MQRELAMGRCQYSMCQSLAILINLKKVWIRLMCTVAFYYSVAPLQYVAPLPPHNSEVQYVVMKGARRFIQRVKVWRDMVGWNYWFRAISNHNCPDQKLISTVSLASNIFLFLF